MSTTVTLDDTHGGGSEPPGRPRPSLRQVLVWTAVPALGAVAWTVLALARGKTVSALWILFAALCWWLLRRRQPTGEHGAGDDHHGVGHQHREEALQQVPSQLVEPADLFAAAAEKRAVAEHQALAGAGDGGRR